MGMSGTDQRSRTALHFAAHEGSVEAGDTYGQTLQEVMSLDDCCWSQVVDDMLILVHQGQSSLMMVIDGSK